MHACTKVHTRVYEQDLQHAYVCWRKAVVRRNSRERSCGGRQARWQRWWIVQLGEAIVPIPAAAPMQPCVHAVPHGQTGMALTLNTSRTTSSLVSDSMSWLKPGGMNTSIWLGWPPAVQAREGTHEHTEHPTQPLPPVVCGGATHTIVAAPAACGSKRTECVRIVHLDTWTLDAAQESQLRVPETLHACSGAEGI